MAGRQPVVDPKQMGNDPNLLRKLVRDKLAAGENFVGRIDLKTMADEGIVCEEAIQFAVSPDGRYLYPNHAWGRHEGRRIEILGKTASGVAAKVDCWEPESGRSFMVDPRGQYVFAKDEAKVYSASLRHVAAQFKYLLCSEIAVFRTHPFVAGLHRGRTLILCSYNTLKTRAIFHLPKELMPDSPRPTSRRTPSSKVIGFPMPKHLHADDRNGRVILAINDQVMLFPVGGVQGDRVVLHAKVRSPQPIAVGQANAIPLVLSDPSVKVELATPVTGMTVVRGGLQWTPTDDQLGDHSIPLRLSAGDETKKVVIDLKVDRPHATVPFLAGDCCLAPEGHLAAVWSGKIPEHRFWPPRSELPSDWKQHLALVDLKECRVLATTVLPAAVTAVAVDRHYVYVAMKQGKSIEARSHKDLSKVTAASLEPHAQIRAIRSIAGKQLIAVTGYGETLRFSLPDLKAADPPKDASGQQGRRVSRQLQQSPPVPVRDLGAWVYFDGAVYDKATGRACLISSSPADDSHYVITLGAEPKAPSREQLRDNGGRPLSPADVKLAAAPLLWNHRLRPPHPWDHDVRELLLETSTGREIAKVEPNSLLLPAAPLMVTSHGTLSPYDDGDSPRIDPGQGDRPATSTEFDEDDVFQPTADLNVYELGSQKQREKIRLFCNAVPYHTMPSRAHCTRVGGATVAVLYHQYPMSRPDQRLRWPVGLAPGEKPDGAVRGSTAVYSYTFREGSGERLAPPGFQPVQSALSVLGSQTTILKHKLTAAADDARFELVEPQEGIAIDSKTADVTIDGPALTKIVLSKIKDGRLIVPAPPTNSSSRSPKSVSVPVQFYRERAARVFQGLVGREPQGLPALIPITIRMKAGEKPLAQLSYFVFLETPNTELEKLLAAGRLEKLEEAIDTLRQRISDSEDALAKLREQLDVLQRDAKAVVPSLALELRIRLLRDNLQRTSEQVRRAKELLKPTPASGSRSVLPSD